MKNIISVVVIAYNSAASILETLDSVLNQTYGSKLIELIIADDGSKDDTVKVVNEWLNVHKKSFNSVSFHVSEKNRGVAANCNLGWKNSSANWIKTIAADDILMPNCLLDNFEFITAHKDVSIVFSDMLNFSDNIKATTLNKHCKSFFKKSAAEQYATLHKESYLLAPTSFLKKSMLEEVGFANEQFFMIEDYPLWFKVTKAGYRIHHFEKATIFYRNGDSLCQQSQKIGNLDYLSSLYLFQKQCIWPNLRGVGVLKKWDDLLIYKSKALWIKNLGNKNSAVFKCYYKCSYLFRPYIVLRLLDRILKNNV